MTVPGALPHSRFTLMFERFAIEVLLMTQTVKGAMTILRLQWDATWHIIERAVARGKARKEPSLLPRIGMANDAVDKVRRGEHKRLLRDGDDRLKGSKNFWLTSIENHSEKQHARFQSTCNRTLATGRAWSYKELFRDLWAQETEGKAKSYFSDWSQRIIRTKIAPMKKLARSLKERIDNMVTYCTHGITNAVAEGINSKIMSIKRRARGYRNIENFKTAVLLYCGGLDLDP